MASRRSRLWGALAGTASDVWGDPGLLSATIPSGCNRGGTGAPVGCAVGSGPAWAHRPGVRASTSAGQNHCSLVTPPSPLLGRPCRPLRGTGRDLLPVSPGAGGTSVPPATALPPERSCCTVLLGAVPTPRPIAPLTGDPPEAADNRGMAQTPVTPWGRRAQLHITKHKGQGSFLRSSKKPRPQRSKPSANRDHASRRHGAGAVQGVGRGASGGCPSV